MQAFLSYLTTRPPGVRRGVVNVEVEKATTVMMVVDGGSVTVVL